MRRPAARRASLAERGPDDEKELPGERVEGPDVPLGIGRHIDPEDLHLEVDQRRGDEHQPREPAQAEQHRREDQQQHDVERQDVEKGRLEL